MDTAAALPALVQLLAGEFDNRAQALADPAWYVHLRLWQRPLPGVFADGYGLFIEQCGVASGKPPYRQRVLHLKAEAGTLHGQYYGLQDPLRWQGGALAPDRLGALAAADLVSLPTCRVTLSPLAQGFAARMAEGTLGQFSYDGKTVHLRLGFDITPGPPAEFAMYDKGIDPETGRGTWGALMGPFRLVKQQSFAV